MLLPKIFALLFAPAALATPVPGKELVARMDDGDDHFHDVENTPVSYRPDFHQICVANHFGDYDSIEVRCAGGDQQVREKGPDAVTRAYVVECIKEDRFGRMGHSIEKLCDEGYFCLETKGKSVEAAPHIYPPAIKSILCMRIDETLTVKVPSGTNSGLTPMSRLPHAPEGTMYGQLAMLGDVQGMRPAPKLQWGYQDNTGSLSHIIGEVQVSAAEARLTARKQSVHYNIKYDFDHDARFFAKVDGLNPNRRNTIQLVVAIARSLSGPFKKEDIVDMAAIREAKEAAANAKRALDAEQSAS